jgi:hypothetical protein
MSREFNGSSDYVRSSTVAITSFPFTVLAWVNPDINNAEQYAFYAGNGSSTTDYVVLGINASGKARAAVRDAGADNNKVSTGTVSTGAWSLIAGEFDGSGTTLSSVTVVLNETKESPYTTSDAGLLASYTRTSLGRRDRSGADAYFNGHIAYVAVVSVIPTVQDYTDLQTKAPHLVFGSSRVHYWPLTVGDATDWTDEWGSADFGTISGTTATNGAGENPELTLLENTILVPNPAGMRV